MIKQPRISVIIPTFNREKYILDAIQSVFNQTLKPTEIIVIDDGSTDNTKSLLTKFSDQIIYIKCKQNKGPGAARNLGIKNANCEYFSFLDSDDTWNPKTLAYLYQEFKKDSNLQMSFGQLQHHRWNVKSEEFEPDKTASYAPSMCTALIQQEAFLKIGLFKETIRNFEDVEWLSRFMDSGLKIKMIKYVCLNYRIHGTNTYRNKNAHKNKDSDLSILFEILRDSIKRKNHKLLFH